MSLLEAEELPLHRFADEKGKGVLLEAIEKFLCHRSLEYLIRDPTQETSSPWIVFQANE
jgi:hypothetical protein